MEPYRPASLLVQSFVCRAWLISAGMAVVTLTLLGARKCDGKLIIARIFQNIFGHGEQAELEIKAEK